MAFTNLGFGFRHFALEEGPGTIDVITSIGGASLPLSGTTEALRDGRAGGIVEWTETDKLRFVRASGAELIGAVFVPPVHNLTAFNVQNGAGPLILDVQGITPGVPVLAELSTPTAATDLRFRGGTDDASCFLGELIYLEAPATLVAGPVQDYTDENVPKLRSRELEPGGEAVLQRGVAPRAFEYTLTQLGLAPADAVADQVTLEAVRARANTAAPFVLRPTWPTNPPAWVRATRARRSGDNPRRGYSDTALWRYRLELLEHTL